MAPPFIIYALPRSRTAWLSKFLTYGEWFCGHDETRNVRSMADVKSWFAQPNTGLADDGAAPWWRMVQQHAPNIRTVVVRRPVDEVVTSLMNLGITFDRNLLQSTMRRLDAKLDQIEARIPGALSVSFDDLRDEEVCQRVFEHCLPYAHDHAWWSSLTNQNIQINMPALRRYCIAHAPQMAKAAAVAKQMSLSAMAVKPREAPEGIVFKKEKLDVWLKDGEKLIAEHLAVVDKEPDGSLGWTDLPKLRLMEQVGVLEITTARSNGRMFGYLMTLVHTPLDDPNTLAALHTVFYASKHFPGLGTALQRAVLPDLKARGVTRVHMRTGTHASNPVLASIYRRLGAETDGETYTLKLDG